MSNHARLRGLALFDFWIVLALATGLLASVALPNFERARSRPSSRSCAAALKTIACATEQQAAAGRTRPVTSTAELVATLQQQGFLGTGDFGSCGTGAFEVLPQGPFCTRHGFCVPPPGLTLQHSARDQLAAVGCQEVALLARASAEPPYGPFPPGFARRTLVVLWACLALFVVGRLLALRRRSAAKG